MNETILKQMEDEMINLLEEANQIEDKQSGEYETIMNRIDTLSGIINSQYQVDIEITKSMNERSKGMHEWQNSKDNSKREYLLGMVKAGVEVATVVAPILFYAAWMKKGFEFEKEGTFTSTTFKGLFGKFKPTK